MQNRQQGAPLPLVYLATPYNHEDPLVRKKRYERAVEFLGVILAKETVTVFCPIAHNHEAAVNIGLPRDWNFWREIDFPILRRCDMVVVVQMDGWDKSVGIKAEVKEAERWGIPVNYVAPEEIEEAFK